MRSHSPASPTQAANKVPTTASEVADKGAHTIEYAARAGYAAKGVIYMVVGGLATAAAWGAGGETTGSKGAVAAIGRQPFGQAMLWLVAVGLAAYSAWRLFEVVKDPEGGEMDLASIGRRIGYLISAFAYAGLAWVAAPMSLARGGSDNTEARGVAQLMTLPAGRWIVGALGAGVVAYGCWQIYRGLSDRFKRRYDTAAMSELQRRIALYSGRCGLTARGLTYGLIGGFIIVAAVKLNPEATKGVGEALDVLAAQPYGAWVLLAVAIGLFCYGVFCLVQARYRSFPTD